MVCAQAVSQCVRPTGEVVAISELSVTPRLAKAGTTAVVSLRVSPALNDPPKLTLTSTSLAARPLETRAVSGSGGSWVLSFDVDDTFAEGLFVLQADVVDSSGVLALGLSLGSFSVDRTAPTVAPGAALIISSRQTGSLRDVSALSTSTRARVSLALSELLLNPPHLWCGTPQTEVVTFARVGMTTAPWVFDGTLDRAAVPQGPCQLYYAATDLAGNEGTGLVTLEGKGLIIDTEPPAAPAVDTPGQLRYLRAPDGFSAQSTRPSFALEGAPGAVESQAIVVAASLAADGGVEVLADGLASDAGDFAPLSLGGVDRDSVWVQAIDQGGNRSPVVEVRDVRVWLRPGSSGGLYSTPASGGGLLRDDFTRHDPSLLSGLAGHATPVSGGSSWVNAHEVEPGGVNFLACVTDWTRATTLQALDGVMRRFDGKVWVSRAVFDPEVDGSPLSRTFSAAAQTRDNGEIIMFGGINAASSAPLDDTWAWEGRSWRRITPATIPAARFAHAIIPDLVHGRLLMTGGISNAAQQRLADTWEWNGVNWRLLADAGSPAALGQASGTWDDHLQRPLLHVAAPDGGGLFAFVDGGWAPLGTTPASVRDADVFNPVLLSYDPEFHTTLLSAVEANTLSVFALGEDGGWASTLHDRSQPWERIASQCFDPETRRTLVSARVEWQLYHQLSFSVDGGSTTVSTFDTLGALPLRRAPGVAYDPGSGRVIVHGGVWSTDAFQDTWAWDGHRLDGMPVGASPKPVYPLSSRLWYREPAKQLMLYRCWAAGTAHVADLWALGDAGWTAIDAGPMTCNAQQFLGSSLNGDEVWWGGGVPRLGELAQVSSSAWRWSPGAGVRSVGPLPVPVVAATALSVEGGVWVWGGLDQSQVEHTELWRGVPLVASGPLPGRVPDGRDTASSWYDSDRASWAIFGGQQSLAYTSTNWWANLGFEDLNWLTPDGWRQLPTADPEGDGDAPSMALAQATYDPSRHRGVLYGGASTGGQLGDQLQTSWPYPDFWELAVWEHRPAWQSVLRAPSGMMSRGVLSQILVRAIAGGTGTLGGAPADGASLEVFEAGQWVTLMTSTSGLPTPFEASVRQPSVRRHFSDLSSLGVRLRPLGRNERSQAKVSLDELVVVVDYRLR